MFALSDRRPFVVVPVSALLAVGLLLPLRSCRNAYGDVLQRAEIHAERRERAAAVAAYGEAARLRPGSPRPYLEMARIYLGWGRTEEALEAAAEAERLDAEPSEVERLRFLSHARSACADVGGRLSHWEAAADHARQLLRFEPNDREARSTLAEAYLQLREWPAAKSTYEELLASDPTDPTARVRLGALLLGDDPKSVEHLSVSGTDLAEQLLRTFIDGAAVQEAAHLHTAFGRSLIKHREWALAARQLELAVANHPGYSDAHAHLGHALSHMGYGDVAESHLTQAVELEPTSAVAHTFLGLHHDRWGRPAAAREAYEDAHDLAPKNPAICLEVGETWAAEGRYVAAEIWLREAVALRPDDPALWEALARFYVNHNITSNNRATEAAERLVTLAPDSAAAHDLRGRAALQTGRYEAAEGYLRRAIALDAEMSSAHYHLGLVLKATGKVDEAGQAFDRALDLDTSGKLVPLIERAR